MTTVSSFINFPSDIDNCLVDTNICGKNAKCINTDGSYHCICLNGYREFETKGQCSDIDECESGLDDCNKELTKCTNTIGSFSCSCITGYTKSGNKGQCQETTLHKIPLSWLFSKAFSLLKFISCKLGFTDCQTNPDGSRSNGKYVNLAEVGNVQKDRSRSNV
ncbi:hypothetical protein LSH36_872g02001 [Paralvinella palmiformis]|uniref:EGF-like domain-containing protein n=1 Tax=Paralvinella palmiformis TaxID=53620 RepID=A0AAD9IYQ7_9ANNE|nr:hypothetical protein LSH36_872g02001 [Paralvinella palmiformis]